MIQEDFSCYFVGLTVPVLIFGKANVARLVAPFLKNRGIVYIVDFLSRHWIT